MNFIDFFGPMLFERLAAEVYVKDDQTLHVITDLVKRDFGLNFEKIGGGCLTTQMIYTMATAAKIEPKVLVDAINKSKVSSGVRGVTLEKLFTVFNGKNILVDDEMLKFKLSVEAYHTLDESIKEVKSGQPIVFIVGNSYLLRSLNGVDKRGNGIADLTPEEVRNSNLGEASSFHAFMLIGYDSKDDLVILRDTRSMYAYKGFVKVSKKTLDENPHAYKMLAIVVDDVTRKKATEKQLKSFSKYTKKESSGRSGHDDELDDFGYSGYEPEHDDHGGRSGH